MRKNRSRFVLIAFTLIFFRVDLSAEDEETFNLGETEINVDQGKKIEIEELGETAIPTYIFKRDLYTEKTPNDENPLRLLSVNKKIKDTKKQTRKDTTPPTFQSRFEKKVARLIYGSHGSLWGGMEFKTRGDNRSDFSLGLNLFKSDGFRERTATHRFGATLLWSHPEEDRGNQSGLSVSAKFDGASQELSGPRNSPLSDAEVEDTIRSIILNYELAKNATDQIKFKARHQNIERALRNGSIEEEQSARVNAVEVEYFTFLKDKYTLHAGASLVKDGITSTQSSTWNGDAKTLLIGVEGMAGDGWGYIVHLAWRSFSAGKDFLLPGLEFYKKMSRSLRLAIGFSRDTVNPNGVDLLSQFPDFQPKKLAIPRRDRLQLGGDFHPNDKTKITLSTFFDQYRDYLSLNEIYDPALRMIRFTPINIDNSKVYGTSAGMEHKLDPTLTFSTELLFQRSDDDSLDSTIPMVPEHQHSFRLRYRNPSGLSLEATRLMRGSYRVNRGGERLGGHELTNLGVGFERAGSYQFDFRVNNLYDEEYDTRHLQRGAGREYQLEFKYLY